MEIINGKSILITGGTGSFGNAVLKKLLNYKVNEIRILSRDEKKQDDMRRKYNDERLKFYIGDIRDINSVYDAVNGVDFVFHAAALKQVPSCEFYPLEAVKTNILGTENLLNAAIKYSVKKIVCLSTDKAVYPVNAMGMTKAMMEKLVLAKCHQSKSTVICITRYGNVMCSRGSVIPLFVEQINNQKPITITDPLMTRFMMSLEEAVDLVLYAFNQGRSGDIFVQKSPAASIHTLAQAVKNVLRQPEHPLKIIGTRHGEKLYETLLGREEMAKAVDLGDYYRVPPDLRSLDYGKYIEQGESQIAKFQDYNSHNTTQLNVEEMQSLLKKFPVMVDMNHGETAMLGQ